MLLVYVQSLIRVGLKRKVVILLLDALATVHPPYGKLRMRKWSERRMLAVARRQLRFLKSEPRAERCEKRQTLHAGPSKVHSQRRNREVACLERHVLQLVERWATKTAHDKARQRKLGTRALKLLEQWCGTAKRQHEDNKAIWKRKNRKVITMAELFASSETWGKSM